MHPAQAAAEIARLEAHALALEEQAYQAELVRYAPHDLLSFVELTHPGYRAGWVHEELCQALQRFVFAIERGESPCLILSMPPRHGKSAIISRRLPIWFLGRNPSLRVILATYGQTLSSDMSRDAKRVRDATIDAGLWSHLATGAGRQDTESAWEIDGGGGMYAAGIRGGITGKGASLIIVDDPVKNREQADSPTIREKVWKGYNDDLSTRAAPACGKVILATRWHEDDLSGRLIRRSNSGEGERYEVINFPALALEDEEHRRKGEALHPERYPVEWLERRRKALGGRSFAALYQGNPQPAGGLLFKASWFAHRYDCTPRTMAAKCEQISVSVDATFEGTSSWAVLQVWGRYRGRFYLLHQVRERMGYAATKRVMRDLVTSWRARIAVVERKANGPALIDELSAELPCSIIPFDTGARSKATRAELNTAPAAEAGDIMLPRDEDAPWLHGDGVDGYIPEHLAFPLGTTDDQVDATSQQIEYWRGSRTMDRVWSPDFLGMRSR